MILSPVGLFNILTGRGNFGPLLENLVQVALIAMLRTSRTQMSLLCQYCQIMPMLRLSLLHSRLVVLEASILCTATSIETPDHRSFVLFFTPQRNHCQGVIQLQKLRNRLAHHTLII